MELLLELRVAEGAADVRFDCRVDLDPGATVAELRHALRDHATARRASVPPGAVLWNGAGERLDDDHLVAGVPLRSGDRVWLGSSPPRRARPQPDGAASTSPTDDVARQPTPRPMPAPPEPPTGRVRLGMRAFRAASAAYLAEVDAKVAEIDRALGAERGARHRALPPLGQRPGAPSDQLAVRVGTGDEPSGLDVPVEPGGDAELRRIAEGRLRTAGAVVTDVPVALDLTTGGVTGLIGPVDVVHGVARSILGQLALQRSPDSLVLGAVVAPSSLRSFEWMRWLPHVRSPASPLSGESLAVWPAAVDELLRSILEAPASGPVTPPLVIVLDAGAVGGRSDVARLLDVAASADIRLLWLGADAGDAPAQCETTVHLAEGPAASTLMAATSPARTFTAEAADVPTVDRLARRLAPAASRPRRLGVGEVLGGSPVPAEVATAWSLSDGGYLDAPIGSVADGTVSVDLAGSLAHAAVVGEDASERSDLLCSWVAVLAARHPPERVAVLFVDGGSREVDSRLRSLPHRRAVDDDIESTVRAALAERAQALDERGVGDLAAWAAADPTGCPPRLVVVVDDAPDLVPRLLSTVVSAGRLGVHLLVAGEEVGAAGFVRIEVHRGRGTVTDDRRERMPFMPVWSAAPRRAARSGRVRVSALGFGRHPDEEPARAEGSQLEDLLGSVHLAFERSGRAERRRTDLGSALGPGGPAAAPGTAGPEGPRPPP